MCNVGWEQEFFVIGREKYLSRPDLVATGRTLLGQTPLRGQEQSTHYFGKMSPRVRRYLSDARDRMWELGISIDCAHNEVAPGQHEMSPIFSLANLEDRNRTAPFPWCGNRFEFRAVGSNQHIAFPLAMINSAMAESLQHMCDEMDSGKDVDQVIRETIRENQGALFCGNGYSSEFYDFAEKNDLFHLKSSPAAYLELTSEKNVKLFTQLGILTEREIQARQIVLLEAFAMDIQIEARSLLSILQTRILPAAMQDVRLDNESGFVSNALNEKRDIVQNLLAEVDKLSEVFDNFPDDSPARDALYAHETVKPAMDLARGIADRLEGIVDHRLWPIPTYSEMLYDHQ